MDEKIANSTFVHAFWGFVLSNDDPQFSNTRRCLKSDKKRAAEMISADDGSEFLVFIDKCRNNNNNKREGEEGRGEEGGDPFAAALLQNATFTREGLPLFQTRAALDAVALLKNDIQQRLALGFAKAAFRKQIGIALRSVGFIVEEKHDLLICTVRDVCAKIRPAIAPQTVGSVIIVRPTLDGVDVVNLIQQMQVCKADCAFCVAPSGKEIEIKEEKGGRGRKVSEEQNDSFGKKRIFAIEWQDNFAWLDEIAAHLSASEQIIKN